MRRAAPLFVGRHDFQSFAANPGYAKASTVRTLARCELKRRGRLLTFIIEGDGLPLQDVPRHRGHAGAGGPGQIPGG